MRPVLQDVLDEVASLEPKGRWTTSVVYWQNGDMQIQTQHGVVGSKPHMTIYVRTHGPISDATIRIHYLKLRDRRFSFERGSMFPVVSLGWLQRIQAWAVRHSLMEESEADVLRRLEDLIKATTEKEKP